MRYNNINQTRKSPIKWNTFNFSNLNLIKAYNHLIESNTKKNNNNFSPEKPPIQIQSNIYDKSYMYFLEKKFSIFEPKNKNKW